jgi:hypothetical protein
MQAGRLRNLQPQHTCSPKQHASTLLLLLL